MDRIIRATAGDGMIKMAVLDARGMVQRAREIHGCSPTATAALGRTLCGASLLGEALKEEDASLTIRVNGGGPLGSVVAVSDSSGFVRGYVDNPRVDLPLRSDRKLDVGGAVGRDGLLTVSRDLGLKEPYISSTELRSGEIAEDLTAWLLESEQVPSACSLGVLVDTDTSVKAAGGFLVQLMPGADESLIGTLEDNIFLMDQLTTVLDEDGPEEVFRQVLRGLEYHIVAEVPVGYRCPCSAGRIKQALSVLDVKDLEEMADSENSTEVRCQFCAAEYIFTPADLREILISKTEKGPAE